LRLSQRILNRLISPFGYVLISKAQDELVYQYDYKAGGFEEYRQNQIFHNKRKFKEIWADETTLEVIAKDIESRGLARRGLCHGARNGWEVDWFANRLKCSVIGSDISDTAEQVANLVQHDFHEPREEWKGQFSFIFTNSLDQAFDPERALSSWVDQLADGGLIYVEHSMASTAAGACEMDPFGAHPMVMPYLLFQWGKGIYRLEDMVLLDGIEHKRKGKVWIFMIKREAPAAVLQGQ